MSDLVISVEHLTKVYRLGVINHGALRQDLQSWWARTRGKEDPHARIGENTKQLGDKDFLALDDVSFAVRRGESLGIIGGNGAGKSTLLKLLSRITDPTSGFIRIKGRVASLLEVGTGFHPELTGRENIFLNGAVLGMSKAEISRKFDEIVAFSGVEKFIDTPVKRYSSGMYVRLAFAVAANLEAEILIIDEVLAVGDTQFQKKCLWKMEQAGKEGRTVIFVSHNMGAIADLCSRCLLLSGGRLVQEGKTSDVIPNYMDISSEQGRVDLSAWDLDRIGNGPLRLLCLRTTNINGDVSGAFNYGELIYFVVEFSSDRKTEVCLGLSIRDDKSNLVIHVSNIDSKVELSSAEGSNIVSVRLEQYYLKPGKYYVTIWLGNNLNDLNDRVGNCLSFVVYDDERGNVVCQSPILMPAQWKCGDL